MPVINCTGAPPTRPRAACALAPRALPAAVPASQLASVRACLAGRAAPPSPITLLADPVPSPGRRRLPSPAP
eukprot:5853254-Pleurochrysis_carterae.AAC.1